MSLAATSEHIPQESKSSISNPASVIRNSKDIAIFKFKILEEENLAQFCSVSLLPTKFVQNSPPSKFQYLTDGRWLLIAKPGQDSILYSNFIEPYGSHVIDPMNPHKAVEFQEWTPENEEEANKLPMCWDLRYGIFWEYDTNDRVLSYIQVNTISPPFLLSKQQFSPQYFMQKYGLKIKELDLYNRTLEDVENDNMEFIETVEYSGKDATLIILSSLDRIIQLHTKGAYVTEVIKGLFGEILPIIKLYSTVFLESNKDKMKIFFNSPNSHGLIAILRLTKVQISQCLDNDSANEVGLLSKDEQTDLSIALRTLLFDIINHCITLLSVFKENSEENIFLTYLLQLTADVLSSGLQIFYKTEELGQLISSMDSNPNSFQVKILSILLKQLASISDPGLLITHTDPTDKMDFTTEKTDPSLIVLPFTPMKPPKPISRLARNTPKKKNARKDDVLHSFRDDIVTVPKYNFNNKMLQFLLRILRDHFMATLQSTETELSSLVTGATNLLLSIQGDLILRAWRDKVGERQTPIFEEFEKGGIFWLILCYGEELLETCKNLLDSIENFAFTSSEVTNYNIGQALQNPIFTELLPSFVYSFWVFETDQKHVARIMYALLPQLLQLLEKLNNVNQHLDDIKKAEDLLKDSYSYVEKQSVIEIKNTNNDKHVEELDLVEMVTRPGAIFIRLRFDPRSYIDEHDDVIFYSDSNLTQLAKIHVGNEEFVGRVTSIGTKIQDEDFIYVGDSLYINYCNYHYFSNSKNWGIRFVVTAYFPNENIYYQPILDIERGIAMISSAIVSQMINYSPQILNAKQVELDQIKQCQEWLDSPISSLHYGQKPDHYTEDYSLLSSIIDNSPSGAKLISLFQSKVRGILSNHPQSALFLIVSRNIFSCLIYHCGLIDETSALINALENNETPKIDDRLLKLWRSSVSINQWIILQHQKADIQYDTICRSLVHRVNFLLNTWSIFAKDLVIVDSIKQSLFDTQAPVASQDLLSSVEEFVISFIKSEIPLEVIKEIFTNRQKTCSRRCRALEIQQILFNCSELPSIKKSSLWKLSPPSHILHDVGGAFLADRLTLITQYTSFYDLLISNISFSKNNFQEFDIPLAKISFYLMCFKYCYQGDIEIIEKFSLFSIISQLINTCLDEINLLREKISILRTQLLDGDNNDKESLLKKLKKVIKRMEEIQRLYIDSFTFYSLFASQSIGVSFNDFKIPETIKSQAIHNLIEILKKNIFSMKQPEKFEFSRYLQPDISPSIKKEIIAMWETIENSLFIDYSEQSSYGILSLIHSLSSWGLFNSNFGEELAPILFQFIMYGTPRLQSISLQLSSLILDTLPPSKIEPIFASKIPTASHSITFPIIDIFFVVIGKAITLEWENFEPEEVYFQVTKEIEPEETIEEEESSKSRKRKSISSPQRNTIKKRRLSSPQRNIEEINSSSDLNSPQGRRKSAKQTRSKSPTRERRLSIRSKRSRSTSPNRVASDCNSLHFFETKENTSFYQSVSKAFFEHREMKERLWLAQELIYFLRSLLNSALWKNEIIKNLKKSISNIPSMLENILDNSKFSDIKTEYEVLVASLCLLGGNEPINLERDVVSIPKSDDDEQFDQVTILDQIGEHSITTPPAISSTALSVRSFTIRNDLIQPHVRVS